MSITKALTKYAHKLFSAYNNEQTALSVAWWLVEKALHKKRAELLVLKTISPEAHQQIESWIFEITHNHKPVQYILGSVPFLDSDIIVETPILIPRPETESWCHTLITLLKKSHQERFNLLDLCSGTGCIALSIAHAFPYAHITALDSSPHACKLIQANKEKNGIKNCTVLESDLFEKVDRTARYDIITANPPYVSHDEWHALEPRVKQWESPDALIADNNGLALIEKIITTAPAYLRAAGNKIPQLWLEIGESQGEKVEELFKKAHYRDITVHTDLYGKNRFITASPEIA